MVSVSFLIKVIAIWLLPCDDDDDDFTYAKCFQWIMQCKIKDRDVKNEWKEVARERERQRCRERVSEFEMLMLHSECTRRVPSALKCRQRIFHHISKT